MAETHFNLRKRTPISYFEPEEPSFDEYLYCDQCSDYVYEYCAIHGHLLVIPDDKVPVRTKFPSFVPRAALTIPHVFLHLAPSIIPGAGLGVFSTLTLPRGVRFGPYRGQRTQEVDSMYCWQIFSRNNKPLHVVDAADSNRSNWMRYVNCARHWREQNLLAYQYQGELYYRTIKTIPRFTELLVFYGSEFANVLHINIGKYNCDRYYRDLQLSSTPFIVQQQRNNLQKTIKVSEKEKPIFISNEDENNKNIITNSNKEITSNNENFDNYPYKLNVNGDTIEIEFKPTCEICQKTFSNRRNLYRHIKIHTGIIEFSCQKCPYTTNINYNYQRHCQRHEKPKSNKNRNYYSTRKKCEMCDFITISRKVLQTHRSKHKGNVYKCEHCVYSNHSKCNLSRHIFNIHKGLF
ncbi:unnamed protein product [Chrysodeixis includens]|uniref:Uncharacterized protein n=1 Tax=Chrysodeixis includens TaxID=689277 RepID=A0A9P0C0F9_CHRIL|nr:unnamed protein product [Chrysodeixis includens]